MLIVWRLRGNIIRTALCWIVRHNVHSPQHTYMSSSYWSNRLGLSHWDPYAVHRGGCLEYCCIIVTWCSGSGGIQAWSRQPTGFLRCFDTVGLVIWPVKIVPEMTYYVSSGKLTLSSPVVPNGYTTKCSKPYWSNPPFYFFLTFGHSGAQDWAPECPNVKKNKNGGLDQYGFEHFVV